MDRLGHQDPRVHQLLLQYQFRLTGILDHSEMPLSSCSDKTLIMAIAGYLTQEKMKLGPAMAYWDELISRDARIHPWVVIRVMRSIAHIDRITKGKQTTSSPIQIFQSWITAKNNLPIVSLGSSPRYRGPSHELIRLVLRRGRQDWAADAYELFMNDESIDVEAKTLLRQAASTPYRPKVPKTKPDLTPVVSDDPALALGNIETGEENLEICRDNTMYIMSG